MNPTKSFATFLFFLFITAISLFGLVSQANAACTAPTLGVAYTVSANCTFDGLVNGSDAGITIDASTTLTANAGQTIVWAPGSSLVINGSIAISATGQLKQTYLWQQDADADGYPDQTRMYTGDTAPASGYTKRSLMISYTTVDSYPSTNTCTTSCAGNTITVVDSVGSVGEYTSITLGSDNFPVISYRDGSPNFDLKVVKCGNAACSAGNTITTVDSAGSIGTHISITLGSDTFPVISYFDNANADLKVAKCGNASCSAGNTITIVDSNDSVGTYTSITLGSDNFPVISYQYLSTIDLKVVKCGNAACSAGNTITVVDSVGDVGTYTSITLGSDTFPVISYYANSLRVAKCGNASCSAGNTITTVDSVGSVGTITSITLGSDTFPVIAYNDGTNSDLKVAKCGNAACSAGNTITTVDSVGFAGTANSITLGSDNFPVISSSDQNGVSFAYRLKVVKCGNAACSAGNTITVVDSDGYVGSYTSITLGSDNFPVISYLDGINEDLKVVKCANAACSSPPAAATSSTCYIDSDGDGYGASYAYTCSGTLPSGMVTNATDCNDANASIFPGAGC